MKKILIFALVICSCAAMAQTPDTEANTAPQKPDQPKEKMTPRHPFMHNDKALEKFLLNFPENERPRLKKLAKENPEAFRKEIGEHFQKERQKEMGELLKLRAAYLHETDPARKAEIATELRSKMEANFDKHLKFAEEYISDNEKKLQRMEKRLKEMTNFLNHFKADYERRKKGRNEILDKITNEFLNPEKEPEFLPPHLQKK